MPKPQSGENASTAQLAKCQRFQIKRIHRSQLKGAPYNPRRITDANKRKLKASVAKNGMVGAITWNERTGFIVGGHQRVSVMDAIEGTKDYLLDVAVIDVSDAEERAINIALNNQSAMGDWDMEQLGEMLQDGVDLEAAAFEAADVKNMFGDEVFEDRDADTLLALGEKIRAAKETYNKISKSNKSKNDQEFYDVIVWPSKAVRMEFWRELGHEDPAAKHKSGETVQQLLMGE